MTQRKTGIILSYISLITNSVIQLVYVPMLLFYLTKEQYGIYQLMGSLVAYLSIMDFGLANTTTRYLSQAYASKDETKAQQIVSTSHALYLSIALILLITGTIFYGFIEPLYQKTLSATDLLTAKDIYLIMLFNIAITIPSNIFIAVINAHERFIFLRGMNVIKVFLQPLLVWGILAWKASVLNLVIVQTGFNLFMILLNYLYCKKNLQLDFPLNFINKPLMKELTAFSVFVFLHAIMDQVYWRLGPIVLGAFIGVAAVANYAIASQVLSFSTGISATLGGVFLPKLSSIVAQTKDMTQINAIFCKMGRLQFMAIMLLLVGFTFLGKIFIYLWVGPSYTICYYIALILMAAYVLDVAQNIGIPILQAMKKHAFRAYVYVAMAALNVALCIPLAKHYGEIGCACATAICLTLGSGAAINWYYAQVGLDLKRFFCNLAKISIGIGVAVVCIIICFWQFPLQNTWLSLIVHGLIVSGIYALCMWFISFNKYEKQLIFDPLKRIYSLFGLN